MKYLIKRLYSVYYSHMIRYDYMRYSQKKNWLTDRIRASLNRRRKVSQDQEHERGETR